MEKAKVAVIIPYYNGDVSFLNKTVDSILNQTFTDFNVYIVNDGSDSFFSAAVNGLVGKKHSPKINLLNKKNSGCIDSRIFGIKNSQEEYIALCDADDYWDEKKLKKQVQFLEENENYGFVACHHLRDKNGVIYGEVNKTIMPSEPLDMLERLFISSNYGGGNPSTYFFRRKNFIKAEKYIPTDKNECNDTPLLMALAYTGCRFGLVDEVLSYYRVHSEGLSRNNIKIYDGYTRFIKYKEDFLNLAEDLLRKNGYNFDSIKRESLYDARMDLVGRYCNIGDFEKAYFYTKDSLRYRVTIKNLRRIFKYKILSLMRKI